MSATSGGPVLTQGQKLGPYSATLRTWTSAAPGSTSIPRISAPPGTVSIRTHIGPTFGPASIGTRIVGAASRSET